VIQNIQLYLKRGEKKRRDNNVLWVSWIIRRVKKERWGGEEKEGNMGVRVK